ILTRSGAEALLMTAVTQRSRQPEAPGGAHAVYDTGSAFLPQILAHIFPTAQRMRQQGMLGLRSRLRRRCLGKQRQQVALFDAEMTPQGARRPQTALFDPLQ